jgi:glycosyltransferase involved in cell wall biosynthesis
VSEGLGAPLPDAAGGRRPGDPLRVLYVGRLSARKGVDVLLDAAALAVLRGTDVRLELVGAVFPGYEDFERSLHARAATAPLEGRVRFAGFEPDVWGVAAHADVWVVPSRADEPFGNTAVEAVLAGRPLVASRTSGLLEAAADYGSTVLVAPGDPEALADALVSLDRRWPEGCASLVADAELARARHDPRAYQHAVMAALHVDAPTVRADRGAGV